MPTKRLPKTLRRQLEASLESLTPRQAGKLFLLYTQDLDRKKQPLVTTFLNGFPPFDELREAQDKKTDVTSPQSVAEYNGFIFLINVALQSHIHFEAALQELVKTVRPSMERVQFLLTLARVSDVARQATQLLAQQPRPLEVDQYQRLVDWATKEGNDWLDNVAERWAEGEATLGIDWLELDFQDRQRLGAKRLPFPYEEDEQMRRDSVAEEGEEAVLKQYFEGDPQRLEDWLREGGWVDWGRRRAFIEQRKTELEAKLKAAYDAGLLEGFEATTLDEGAYFALKVDKGRIPAWAALRRAWVDWLAERRYFVHERPFASAIWQGYATEEAKVNAVYTVDGLVEGEDLANLVGVFVDECRQRPWGDGLASSFDPVGLGRFLTAKPSALDYIEAPDLGTVDWKVYAEDTGEDPSTYLTLLSRSVEAARQQLGIPEHLSFNQDLHDIQRHYYPADDPYEMGLKTVATADKLGSIRLDTPSFLYGETERHSVFFGEFKTPLQQAVDQLGKVFARLAEIKLAFDKVSDVFFEGISVLTPSQQTRLREIEDALTGYANMVDGWLEDLAYYPWLVDVDRLKLVRREANSARVFLLLARMLQDAWDRVGLSLVDTVNLGDGEFNLSKWQDQQLTPDIQAYIDREAGKF